MRAISIAASVTTELATDPEVLSRVRAWYTAHGMFEQPVAERARPVRGRAR